MNKRSVFLALPAYGGMEPDMALSLADLIFTARAGAGRMRTCSKSISLLAHCFNALWVEALNTRDVGQYTHFAMLHSDIAPESGWLWKMIDEMERVGADILSAVSPIKDDVGDTSTAVLDATTRENHRLNMDDLAQLPETFDGSHWPDKTLLVNTGMWVCDFRKPWVEKVWFEIRDRIERREDGLFEARTMSEDWNLSLMAKDLDLKVFATQKFSLTHWGRRGWKMEGRREPVCVDEIIDVEAETANRALAVCGGSA